MKGNAKKNKSVAPRENAISLFLAVIFFSLPRNSDETMMKE